jgi:hypothetical protein
MWDFKTHMRIACGPRVENFCNESTIYSSISDLGTVPTNNQKILEDSWALIVTCEKSGMLQNSDRLSSHTSEPF